MNQPLSNAKKGYQKQNSQLIPLNEINENKREGFKKYKQKSHIVPKNVGNEFREKLLNNESYGHLLNLNAPSIHDRNEVITNDEKFFMDGQSNTGEVEFTLPLKDEVIEITSYQKSIRDLSNAESVTDDTCKELGIPLEDARILKDLFSTSYKELTHLRDRFKNKEIEFENLNQLKTLRR